MSHELPQIHQQKERFIDKWYCYFKVPLPVQDLELYRASNWAIAGLIKNIHPPKKATRCLHITWFTRWWLVTSWFLGSPSWMMGFFVGATDFPILHGLVKQWSMLDVRTRTFTRRALPRIQLKAMGLDMQLDRLRRPGFWLGEFSTLPGRVLCCNGGHWRHESYYKSPLVNFTGSEFLW